MKRQRSFVGHGRLWWLLCLVGMHRLVDAQVPTPFPTLDDIMAGSDMPSSIPSDVVTVAPTSSPTSVPTEATGGEFTVQTIAFCGDGIVQNNEECDDGEDNKCFTAGNIHFIHVQE